MVRAKTSACGGQFQVGRVRTSCGIILRNTMVTSLFQATTTSAPNHEGKIMLPHRFYCATNTNPLQGDVGGNKRTQHYDLIVIGSGPAAQKCAIDASKKKKTVACIDDVDMTGGVCNHTGTIPSKTFREAVLHLTGYTHQGFYGKSYQSGNVSVGDILHRVGMVVSGETDVVTNQLLRNQVTFYNGRAKFVDSHTIEVMPKTNNGDAKVDKVSADYFLIATGSRPAQRQGIDTTQDMIFDSDQLLQPGWKVPRDFIVAGAGVIGMEYASMISIIPGSRVTVIESRDKVLPFADKEIIDSLVHVMRQNSTRFLLNEDIKGVECCTTKDGEQKKVCVTLESGKKVIGDAFLYTVGRQGNTDNMGLEDIGITPSKRGLITVNSQYQTELPHIYAAGDCIGFPALASTSMEQGRLASCHMFAGDHLPQDYHGLKRFPYGIYTIPEISVIGANEQTLTEENIPYEVGIARYGETAKGQMLGGSFGLLKILFDPVSHQVLGVHCIGEGATEIIHIGQIVMDMKAPIEYFRDAVFNYPTLAEAYRIAAINGLQRVTGIDDNEEQYMNNGESR